MCFREIMLRAANRTGHCLNQPTVGWYRNRLRRAFLDPDPDPDVNSSSKPQVLIYQKHRNLDTERFFPVYGRYRADALGR